PEGALHDSLALNLVVRLVINGIELVNRLLRLWHDLLVFRQLGFAPNTGVGEIFGGRLGWRLDDLAGPITCMRDRMILVGGWRHRSGQLRRRENTRLHLWVLEIARLLRPDGSAAGYQDKLVVRRKLHHFTRGQERPGCLLS